MIQKALTMMLNVAWAAIGFVLALATGTFLMRSCAP